MMTTNDTDKYVIILPVEGTPFIFGIYKQTVSNLLMLQDCVDGKIEPYDPNGFIIHPMFCQSRRWDMIRQMLSCKQGVKVYVNQEGYEECSPNHATVIKDPKMRRGGCPHLMGNVALVVTQRVMNIICPNVAALNLHRYKDEDGDVREGWEFNNDEEEEVFKQECAEKGYDYIESTGLCYLGRV